MPDPSESFKIPVASNTDDLFNAIQSLASEGYVVNGPAFHVHDSVSRIKVSNASLHPDQDNPVARSMKLINHNDKTLFVDCCIELNTHAHILDAINIIASKTALKAIDAGQSCPNLDAECHRILSAPEFREILSIHAYLLERKLKNPGHVFWNGIAFNNIGEHLKIHPFQSEIQSGIQSGIDLGQLIHDLDIPIDSPVLDVISDLAHDYVNARNKFFDSPIDETFNAKLKLAEQRRICVEPSGLDIMMVYKILEIRGKNPSALHWGEDITVADMYRNFDKIQPLETYTKFTEIRGRLIRYEIESMPDTAFKQDAPSSDFMPDTPYS